MKEEIADIPRDAMNVIFDNDGNAIYRLEREVYLKLVKKKRRHLGSLKGDLRFGQATIELLRGGREHFYRNGPGWGMNYNLFLRAANFGFSKCHFVSKYMNIDKWFTVEEALANFLPMKKYKMQGFEQQKLLHVDFFMASKPVLQQPKPKPPREPDDRQGSLF